MLFFIFKVIYSKKRKKITIVHTSFHTFHGAEAMYLLGRQMLMVLAPC